MGPGEVAEFDTRLPHWFGPAGDQPVEILSLLGRQGEPIHVRAAPRRRLTPRDHPGTKRGFGRSPLQRGQGGDADGRGLLEQPGRPGPGRTPGVTNRHRATRHAVGKTVKRDTDSTSDHQVSG